MADSIQERVVVGVVTAVILGALTLLWNWVSEGGIVRALGGMTKAKIEEKLAELKKQNDFENQAMPIALPAAAVIVIDDTNGCPTGWQSFDEAGGRFLLGVGGQEGLTAKSFRQIGGAEAHTLTAEEMPKHVHSMGIRVKNEGGGDGYPYARPDSPGAETAPTGGLDNAEIGTAVPHNNMPPYIALYFCKKEAG